MEALQSLSDTAWLLLLLRSGVRDVLVPLELLRENNETNVDKFKFLDTNDSNVELLETLRTTRLERVELTPGENPERGFDGIETAVAELNAKTVILSEFRDWPPQFCEGFRRLIAKGVVQSLTLIDCVALSQEMQTIVAQHKNWKSIVVSNADGLPNDLKCDYLELWSDSHEPMEFRPDVSKILLKNATAFLTNFDPKTSRLKLLSSREDFNAETVANVLRVYRALEHVTLYSASASFMEVFHALEGYTNLKGLYIGKLRNEEEISTLCHVLQTLALSEVHFSTLNEAITNALVVKNLTKLHFYDVTVSFEDLRRLLHSGPQLTMVSLKQTFLVPVSHWPHVFDQIPQTVSDLIFHSGSADDKLVDQTELIKFLQRPNLQRLTWLPYRVMVDTDILSFADAIIRSKTLRFFSIFTPKITKMFWNAVMSCSPLLEWNFNGADYNRGTYILWRNQCCRARAERIVVTVLAIRKFRSHPLLSRISRDLLTFVMKQFWVDTDVETWWDQWQEREAMIRTTTNSSTKRRKIE